MRAADTHRFDKNQDNVPAPFRGDPRRRDQKKKGQARKLSAAAPEPAPQTSPLTLAPPGGWTQSMEVAPYREETVRCHNHGFENGP